MSPAVEYREPLLGVAVALVLQVPTPLTVGCRPGVGLLLQVKQLAGVVLRHLGALANLLEDAHGGLLSFQ